MKTNPRENRIFATERAGGWWIKRAIFVLKFLLKSGQKQADEKQRS